MLLLKDVIILIVYFLSIYFAVFWLVFFLERYSDIEKESKKSYKPKKYLKVTIVIPAYNEEKAIFRTLKSLVNLDYPKEFIDILVINDGSKDNTEKIVKNFIKNNPKSNISYHKTKNKGKASALNYALKIATGEYFVCLDADSYVEKDALTQTVGFIQQDKDLVIVTPVMHVESSGSILQKLQKVEYLVAMLLVKLMGYIDSNFIAPGPFSLYKTKIIKSLGGFDEDNLTEDQEMAYKVQTKHLKIRQCQTTIVYTKTPETFMGLYKQRNRWFKGTLQNLFKYKSIILNRKYGDFGVFQMPINISAFVFAIISIIFFLYNLIKPLSTWVKELYLVNFDIAYLIKNIDFSFSFLNINILNWYIILSFLLLSGFMFYMATKINRKPIKEYGVLVLIPYFFIYFILLSFFAVIVLIESIFGVKQKW